MSWLKEAVCDNDSGLMSSTRIVILLSSTTLSISTLIMTVLVYLKPELVPALTVIAGGLAGMSGMTYTAQRFGTRTDKSDSDA